MCIQCYILYLNHAHTVQYYTILYCTIPYYAVLYYIVLYYTVLYNTILYYAITLCVRSWDVVAMGLAVAGIMSAREVKLSTPPGDSILYCTIL